MRGSLKLFFFSIYSQQICKVHHAILRQGCEGGEKDWIIACNGDAFYRVILVLVQAPTATGCGGLLLTLTILFDHVHCPS